MLRAISKTRIRPIEFNMRNKVLTTIVIAVSLFGNKLIAQDISGIGSGGKLNPLQSIMDIRHYALSLNVDIDNKRMGGYAEIELVLLKPTDTLLFDLLSFYKISKVLVDNSSQSFTHQDHQIIIPLKKHLPANKHTIKIYYDGNPKTNS